MSSTNETMETNNSKEKVFIDTLFDYMHTLTYSKMVFATKTDQSEIIPFNQSLKYLGKYKYTFYFFNATTVEWACHDINMPFKYDEAKLTVSITPALGMIEIKSNSKRFGLVGGEPCYQTFYVHGSTAHNYMKSKVTAFVNRVEELFNSNDSKYRDDCVTKRDIKTIRLIFEPYVKGESTL